MLASRKLEDTLVKGASDDDGDKRPYDLAEDYWLARPYYSEEFAQEATERFGGYAKSWQLSTTPLSYAMWQAYRVYHGLVEGEDNPNVSLMEAGEQGEFLKLFVNHFRGLIRHQNALITSDRLVWDVMTSTSDSEALRQVTLTQNICDWAVDARGYASNFALGLEHMRVLASSFIAQGWNPNAGLKGAGDIWCNVLAPWECMHEEVRNYDDSTYWIFVRWESRWEWAAHFKEDDPAKARKIANLEPSEAMQCGVAWQTNDTDERGKDRIPVLYVYAIPTRAVPQGRLAILAGSEPDLILQDGPYPYGAEPVIRRMCSARFLGTEMPIGNSWTLLPIQEALDAINSTVITRADMFGVPNVAVPDGTEFEASDIGGANKIGLPPGAGSEAAPVVVDFLQIPSALGKERESLQTSMEMLSGINSVTRGNPTENITSGSMAALVQQMAQQFNGEDERAYVTCVEQVATDMIRIYQRMATEEQLISIAGKDERYSARSFKKEELSLVQRVKIKIGNAMSRNISGRLELANGMMDRGMFQDPREFLQYVQTGNYKALFADATNELANINAENEALARGEDPPVDLWDNDIIHIREQKGQLDTLLRLDKPAADRVKRHLMAHIQNWQNKTLNAPEVLEAIGQAPLTNSVQTKQQADVAHGKPPQPPGQDAPPQQRVPNSVDRKAKPGPAPAQPGQEQPEAQPNMPAPASAPRRPQA